MRKNTENNTTECSEHRNSDDSICLIESTQFRLSDTIIASGKKSSTNHSKTDRIAAEDACEYTDALHQYENEKFDAYDSLLAYSVPKSVDHQIIDRNTEACNPGESIPIVTGSDFIGFY